MTTSGTYNTVVNYNFAEMTDEAWRRCKIAPQTVSAEQMVSATYTINFLLTSWANQAGNEQFLQSTQTYDLVGNGIADIDFTMPTGGIDIISMVYLNANNEAIQIKPIGRQDYLYINDKTIQGQPLCYFVNKSTIPPVVNLWPVQNITGTSIQFTMLSQAQDMGTWLNTPSISVLYTEAFVSAIAAKLSEKYCDPALEVALTAKAIQAFMMAEDQDRNRACMIIKPRLGRRYYYGI